MRRTNTQTLGEAIRDFFETNNTIREKILLARAEQAWEAVLGPTIGQYTRQVFVKERILHVSLTSSVLRNELNFSKEQIIKQLNQYIGTTVLDDIILR